MVQLGATDRPRAPGVPLEMVVRSPSRTTLNSGLTRENSGSESGPSVVYWAWKLGE